LLRAALLADAAGMILVHNHPSGTPTPSAADRQIHDRLTTAAKQVDLTLLDSVIVENGAYVSLAERGA
jgi:DNA repair protein RadC